MSKSKLVKLMERYHEHFHLTFGLLSLIIVLIIFPGSDILSLFFIIVIGSFLPDADHLLFFFVYGRSTKYARTVRDFLKQKDFKNAAEFCRLNHKSNTLILSHNLLTPLISFLLFLFSTQNRNQNLSAFFLSWTMHFVFDIIEDLLAKGKLNPNWYLKFRSMS